MNVNLQIVKAKCINVLDAIMWTKQSWDLIRTSTISNYFCKCGFLTKVSGDTSKSAAHDVKYVKCRNVFEFDKHVTSCNKFIYPKSLKTEIFLIYSESESVSDGGSEIKNKNIDTPSENDNANVQKKQSYV